MTNFIEIKSKRQNNGLWGIPQNLISTCRFSVKHEILQSAIIATLGEVYNDANFNIESWFIDEDKGFMIHFDRDVLKGNLAFKDRKIIHFEKYYLEGNRLYFFKTTRERKTFILNKKIKKVKNQFLF